MGIDIDHQSTGDWPSWAVALDARAAVSDIADPHSLQTRVRPGDASCNPLVTVCVKNHNELPRLPGLKVVLKIAVPINGGRAVLTRTTASIVRLA
jgi:hypothetical protein